MKKFVECDLLRAMQFFSKKTRKYNAKKGNKMDISQRMKYCDWLMNNRNN